MDFAVTDRGAAHVQGAGPEVCTAGNCPSLSRSMISSLSLTGSPGRKWANSESWVCTSLSELGGGGADVVTSVLAAEALGEAGVDGGLTLSDGAHTYLCADTIFTHGTGGSAAEIYTQVGKRRMDRLHGID